MKKTQPEIVAEKLKRDGFCSNLWAINHGIWRLGSAVCYLRRDGAEIYGCYGERLGLSKRHRKNFIYFTASALRPGRSDIRPATLARMERER